MEENVGKDLALDMKKDEELLKKIRELQNKKREEKQNENIDIKYYENCELKLGKNSYPLKVSVAEITEKMLDRDQNEEEVLTYDIYMKYDGQDVLIASINEQGKLIINREEVEKIDPENKLGLLELGEEEKPDLSALKELDGKTEKELEKDKEDKEKEVEETAKDDNEEKKEDENKEEDRDEEKEQIAKKYNLKPSQVVHIDMGSEKITDDKTFAQLVRWAEGKKDIYVIPGKDPYTWKIIGREKENQEFTEIEEANRQIYGKNPDITIKRIDGEKITEVKPIAVHDIDGESAIAIVKDAYGQPEALYCRKEEGEQKYWGTVVPEVSGKNVRQMEYDEREFMSSKYNSGMDLDRKAEELEKAQEFDERGVPSKEEGVQVYEIEGNSEQNRNLTKENIKDDLYKRKGIDEKVKGAMPGYLDYIDKQIDGQADKILNLMDSNKNMTYEQAIERIEGEEERENEGELEGRTRGEDAWDRRHNF